MSGIFTVIRLNYWKMNLNEEFFVKTQIEMSISCCVDSVGIQILGLRCSVPVTSF